MQTSQLYLEDSYTKEFYAKVLEVAEEDERYKVVLDKTYFYPMGGGQPTDQGKMTADGLDADVFQVIRRDGEIWHYLKTEQLPEFGMEVSCSIDWDRRYKYMKIHSAGHIIDFGLYALGYSPDQLYPTKGDHGKKAYLLYEGSVDEHDLKEQIQTKVDELINKDLEFSTEEMSYKELEENAIYLQPYLPKNKKLRSLTLEGLGTVADGGTQVAKTSEIGEIVIDSVEIEDGNTLIKYSVL